MRFTHIIKRNKTSESPQRIIAVSIACRIVSQNHKETVHVLARGYAVMAVKGKRGAGWTHYDAVFETPVQFWRIMESWCRDKTRTYCFVENAKKTLALLDTFTVTWKRGWTCTQAVIECPPTIVRWRTPRGSFVLLEKRNIWPTPSSNCSNGETVLPLTKKRSASERCSKDETLKRNALSTLSLVVEWTNFLHTNNLGTFAPTIASQAMRVFRHRYMTTNILVDCNEAALKISRTCYAGGRTECLRLGKYEGEFFLVDVNSMYASVMCQMQVPVRLRGYTEHAGLKDLALWTENDVVIVDCNVETRENCYPFRSGARLLFPIGSFRTILGGVEALHALRRDDIRTIHRVAVYDGAQAFTEFSLAMWDLRQCEVAAGNDADAEKYKSLLASFYGKWGQHGGVWEKWSEAENGKIEQWIDFDVDTRTVHHFRQFGGIVQKLSSEAESFESHPAIAACITAGARFRLWQLMKDAGLENVFYVDTDSLLVTRRGFEKLRYHLSPETLGGLRLVGKYDRVEIFAPKDYVFGSRKRCKGRSREARSINETVFEQNEQLSILRMARGGRSYESIERRVVRHSKRTYEKGVTQNDCRVEPLRMDIHET